MNISYMRVDTDLHDRLLILPGLMCDAAMFAGIRRAWAKAQVIDDHYGGADRIEQMAAHVLTRAPARFDLIGHSMGARVALAIVARAPDRVGRLMLVDTGIHGVEDAERIKRHALRDLGRREGFGALVDAWLPPMVGNAGRSNSRLMAMLRAMCLRAGQKIFEAQTEALLNRPDTGPALRLLSGPVNVVVGGQDQWSTVAQHEAIAARIAGARLHIVEDAGHMAPAEQPQQFNRIIREWLARPVRPICPA